MFYMAMVIDLILIGTAFFLWYRLNKEGFIATENGAVTEATPAFKPKRGPTSSSKQKSQRHKSKKQPAVEPEEEIEISMDDEMDWGNFEMNDMEPAAEETREMDEELGLKKRRSPKRARGNSALNLEPKTEAVPASKPTKKKDPLDDLYSELFTDDEMDMETEFTPVSKEPTTQPSASKPALDPSIFKEEEEEENTEADLEFLERYDFSSKGEDTLGDDIFEQARKGKAPAVEEDDSELMFGDTEDDYAFIPKQKEKKKKAEHSLIDEEDDEIFEKLERLRNNLQNK